MLDRSLSEKLACPKCRGGLTTKDDSLTCPECSMIFPMRAGVPSFLSAEPKGAKESTSVALSVLVMAKNEGANLGGLLEEMHGVLRDLSIEYELIVIDGRSTDQTVESAAQAGARVYTQERPGYGNGFREGLQRCSGEYILTFDADGSHDPNYIRVLWQHRERAELIVGSRYLCRGEAWMPWSRVLLSRVLNLFMTSVLSLPLKDVSSGFRLYKREALQDLELEGRDFDVLIELLAKMVQDGYRVLEVPFIFKPRQEGVSKVSLAKFALSYARSAWRLWRGRNSIEAADYDSRAYHSRIYPQRYWQRRRYQIISGMLGAASSDILDVGCGSSKIIQSYPGAVGLDYSLKKLRFLRETNTLLLHGSVFSLPLKDESFSVVVCSQVIEHIPDTPKAVAELLRVLKPGGKLILGTPDFGSWQWPLIERVYERVIPGGYAEEHINPLTRDQVVEMVSQLGADYLGEDFICRAEWVGLFQKRTTEKL